MTKVIFRMTPPPCLPPLCPTHHPRPSPVQILPKNKKKNNSEVNHAVWSNEDEKQCSMKLFSTYPSAFRYNFLKLYSLWTNVPTQPLFFPTENIPYFWIFILYRILNCPTENCTHPDIRNTYTPPTFTVVLDLTRSLFGQSHPLLRAAVYRALNARSNTMGAAHQLQLFSKTMSDFLILIISCL